MPELPDIMVYVEAVSARVLRRRLSRVRVVSPFVVRSVEPPIETLEGRDVTGVRRLGKRIVIELDREWFIAVHLMILGRLQWTPPKKKPRRGLIDFVFEPAGTLTLTEQGTEHRAAVHALRGEQALAFLHAGGVDVLEADLSTFTEVLKRENHTLKRALTDPRLFDGIGNAYSDEILHAARLSPITLTSRLDDAEIARLFGAAQDTLRYWMERLRAEAGDRFPTKVTAFRPDMAVHGRFNQPCPACGTPVQRIVYAANETNYCPTCQTGGRVLKDRSLSRLLRDDWPGTIEAMNAETLHPPRE